MYELKEDENFIQNKFGYLLLTIKKWDLH